jgi:thymidylate synthase
VVIEAQLAEGTEPPSPHYPTAYEEVISTYAAGFLGRSPSEHSTVSRRLFHWPNRPEGEIDQVDRAANVIRSQRNTRFNILGFWDPALDPDLPNPVSPLSCNLRLRAGILDGTLVARTVDAWLGALPMFIALSGLVNHLAARTGTRPGAATILLLSYHVYELDLPVVRATAQDLAVTG